MSKLIAWSWSRLSDFKQCPHMFKGKHITKEMKVDFTSPHLQAGREAHKVMEDAVAKGKKLPPMYEYLQPLINALRKQQAIAEKQFTFDSRGKNTSWFSKAAYVRCALDVICSDKDPYREIIIDWKTGKVRRDSAEQLRFYAGVKMHEDSLLEGVTVAYVWLDHPSEPPMIATYDRSQFQEIWDSFHEQGEAIQRANQSGNWPKRKNHFCHWCPATTLQCEYASDDQN